MSPKFLPIMRRRKLLLSKSVYAPYAGYAKSQMLRAEKNRLDNKAMMHCLRLLWQAVHILRSRGLPVKVTGPMRDALMAVRNGEEDHEESLSKFRILMEQLDDAKFTSALPAEPPRKEFEYAVMAIQAKELKGYKFNDKLAFELASGHRAGATCKSLARKFVQDITEVRNLLATLGIDTHRWGNPFVRRDRARKVVNELRSGKTLSMVGKEYGLTRERVRQIAKQGGIRSLRAERQAEA